MRKTLSLGLLLIAGSMIPAQRCEAQRPPWLKEPYLKPAIYGKVADSAPRDPIAFMRLRIDGRGAIASTDSTGWYLLFDMPVGVHQVHFFGTKSCRFTADLRDDLEWQGRGCFVGEIEAIDCRVALRSDAYRVPYVLPN